MSRITFSAAFVIALLMLIAPQMSHAATVAQLQAQIAAVLAQIQALQQTLPPAPPPIPPIPPAPTGTLQMRFKDTVLPSIPNVTLTVAQSICGEIVHANGGNCTWNGSTISGTVLYAKDGDPHLQISKPEQGATISTIAGSYGVTIVDPTASSTKPNVNYRLYAVHYNEANSAVDGIYEMHVVAIAPSANTGYTFLWDFKLSDANAQGVVTVTRTIPTGRYYFEVVNANNSVFGSVSAYVNITGPQTTKPSATIDAASLSTTSLSPTISGTASGAGISAIGFSIASPSGDKAYGSGWVPVTNGRWSKTVTPPLTARGAYTVTVNDRNNATLATGRLLIYADGPTPVPPPPIPPIPPAPPVIPVSILAFTTSQTTISPGDSVTLTWSSIGADKCSIDPPSPTANVGTTGSMRVVPQKDVTLYMLRCWNSRSTAEPVVRTIRVAAIVTPVIKSFVATPASIWTGATSTLAWSTLDADTCSIYTVTDTSSTLFANSVGTAGSRSVAPFKTTTYQLYCWGSVETGNRNATSNATVTVTNRKTIQDRVPATTTTTTTGSNGSPVSSTSNLSASALSSIQSQLDAIAAQLKVLLSR